MKINPVIILAAIAVLGVVIWFFSTAEFSNKDMTTDYVAPITDETGASLSGSNLIVMDPTTGNMRLAPVDAFDSASKANLNKIVGNKVPAQILKQINNLRGGEQRYTGTLKDLYNGLTNRYTKAESDGKYYTKTVSDDRYVKSSTPYYIARYATRDLTPVYLSSHAGNAEVKSYKYGNYNNTDKQRFVLVPNNIGGSGQGLLSQHSHNS